MNNIKKLLVALCVVAMILGITCEAKGGKVTDYTFTYTVLSEDAYFSYHTYAVAARADMGASQPSGTIILGHYYVWDLGPIVTNGVDTVTSGTVTFPTLVGQKYEAELLLASSNDTGGDGSSQFFTHAVGDVHILGNVNNPNSISTFIGVIPTVGHAPGEQTLYDGVFFTPFEWDFSPYLF